MFLNFFENIEHVCSCISLIVVNHSLWQVSIFGITISKRNVRLASFRKNSCIRIFYREHVFSQSPFLVDLFSKSHSNKCLRNIFQRLCIFENFIFEITFFEYYFEKHSFKYVCENKFVENSFRNHENFRNLIFWMISKILHMSMFSINTLSRTHLVIFSKISQHICFRKCFFFC